ncbi:MAG: HAD family phosphatase [Thermoguttaceae bacterium]|nr:HAD family phosphatase [Thermoguttaceae bacterium]
MSTPEFLFFDMGNVLIHFDLRTICDRMAKVAGVTSELVFQKFFSCEGILWEAEAGRLTRHELYEKFCERTDSHPSEVELDAASCSTFTINTQMLPVLMSLKRAGNRIGILSNICESHWVWCLSHYRFLTDLFDFQLASYQLKCSKPGMEIFKKAQNLAGVTDSGRVFFTDDIPRNVDGADAAGWDAEPFTNVPSLVASLRKRHVTLASY